MSAASSAMPPVLQPYQILFRSEQLPVMQKLELCVYCGSHANNSKDLIACRDCGDCFHTHCFNPPVAIPIEHRGTWRCMRCKNCEVCGGAHNDNLLLVCDVCERGYHTFCLKPSLSSVPKQAWICNDCLPQCDGCGMLMKMGEEGRRCSACETRYSQGLYCPVCLRTYSATDYSTKMVSCGKCHAWIHIQCDKITEEHYSVRRAVVVNEWIYNRLIRVPLPRKTLFTRVCNVVRRGVYRGGTLQHSLHHPPCPQCLHRSWVGDLVV